MKDYGSKPPALATNDMYDDHEYVSVTTRQTPHERNGRRPAIRLLQRGEPMVYAARMPDGIIKIGCTRDLYTRLSQLGGELLGFQFGDYDDEKTIHRSLSRHLDHGREWFRPEPEVLAVVNSMREPFGLEPLAA